MTYDPTVGKWLSEDPIGFEGGTTNLMEYVGNGPTNGVDRTGLALEVDGVPITTTSPLYKKTTGETERATLDAMINSKTSFKRTAEEMDVDLKFRANMVKAARDLHKRDPGFPRPGDNVIGAPQACEFWEYDKERAIGRLFYTGKPYQDSFSDAIDELYAGYSELTTECSRALTIVYLRALRDTIGKEKFDLFWSYKQAGPDNLELYIDAAGGRYAPGYRKVVDGPYQGYTEDYYADHLPGDWSGFVNKDVSEGDRWAWQNENVIKLPNGEYYGHGIGIKSHDGMLDALAKHADGRRTAQLVKQWNFDPKLFLAEINHGVEMGRKQAAEPGR